MEYLPYVRGTRTVAGDIDNKFLFTNLMMTPEGGKAFISAGILDISGHVFYPLSFAGQTPTEPAHGSIYRGDGHSITALFTSTGGHTVPALCPMVAPDGVLEKYPGCIALKLKSTKQTMTIPVDVPIAGKKQKAGQIINGVVFLNQQGRWIPNPFGQVFWNAITPYQNYSAAVSRHQSDSGDGSLLYAGSLPDMGMSYYVNGFVNTNDRPVPQVFAYPSNSNETVMPAMRNRFVIGSYNHSHVWAGVKYPDGSYHYFLSDDPLNVNQTDLVTSVIVFPYVHRNIYDPIYQQGYTMYQSYDGKWHFEVGGIRSYVRSYIKLPEIMGADLITESTDFYRNYVGIQTKSEEGFNYNEYLNVEHISTAGSHFGTILGPDKSSAAPVIYQIDLSDEILSEVE